MNIPKKKLQHLYRCLKQLKSFCADLRNFNFNLNIDHSLTENLKGQSVPLRTRVLRLTVRVADTLSLPQTKVYSPESSLLLFMTFK